MGELILIDVRPRYEYATVDLGEAASFNIWLQMINLSPFDVELDRAELRFWCGGTVQNASILRKMALNSGKVLDLYLTESIADGHASQIARNLDNHRSAIEINIEFNCKLHSFNKYTGQLSGVLPRFINQQMRLHTE
jgi:hypothetical protein